MACVFFVPRHELSRPSVSSKLGCENQNLPRHRSALFVLILEHWALGWSRMASRFKCNLIYVLHAVISRSHFASSANSQIWDAALHESKDSSHPRSFFLMVSPVRCSRLFGPPKGPGPAQHVAQKHSFLGTKYRPNRPNGDPIGGHFSFFSRRKSLEKILCNQKFYVPFLLPKKKEQF